MPNFKQSFLAFMRDALEGITPDGYTVKVIDEYGAGAEETPKFTIFCYIKFGVGNKQLNTSDRINQPIIMTIKATGDDHRMSYDIFNTFFMSYSKTRVNIEVDDDVYDVWLNFNTPTIQDGVEKVGLHFRKTILMTGIISYSLNKIVGVKYYIDNNLINVVNPNTSYNTVPTTPNYHGDSTGKVKIEGANNVYTFTMLLDNSATAKKFLKTSIDGTKCDVTLKIEYNPYNETAITYTINCTVTAVGNVHDTPTGDNVLTVTLMPR